MKVLRWIDKYAEATFLATALWSVSFIMFLQVIMRYVFKNTLSWPEEYSRYVFIWFAFIGLSYGIRYNCHIRIDIFESFIPKLKTPLMIIDDLGFFIFCALLWVPGWNSVTGMITSGQRSAAMEISMMWIYLAPFTGFILTPIRIIQKYILLIYGLVKNKKGAK
ncbi:MAG: TRAP transporter small permease [Clostridia bacterium]|nr:TRAP transporter small permease [Clostridia bacterium]